jgi:hypothetical protein
LYRQLPAEESAERSKKDDDRLVVVAPLRAEGHSMQVERRQLKLKGIEAGD